MSSLTPLRQLLLRNCSRSGWTRLPPPPRRLYSSQPPPHRPSNALPRSPKPEGPRPGPGQQPGGAKSSSPPPPPPAKPSRLSRFLEPVMPFFRWYDRQQRDRPYITQLCVTPIIYVLGDLSAQAIGGGDYDPHRTLRAIVIAAVVAIPSYQWFMFLGRHFNYSSPALSTAVKVVVNQIVFGPLFNVYFFYSQALLSGEGPAGALERVKTAVPVSLPRAFVYWPIVMAFNFTYIQPQSRSVVAGMFAVVWQSYLSWLNTRTEEEERVETAEPVSVAAS
ncbi:related to glomerulosclerosis protein Mpv17 [Cephalotrichum gorgonifer]|uniref:Related to glomerulosclerosis protein Mpv17 n=1 Tax=Cephalotrichum gorgonifer TaxID=2041049 RepID=A0AAE8MVM7_9PEZI|nr:related to glomerulosclerosis protein Mpv17 [Cephalotrichum gorgonifer]